MAEFINAQRIREHLDWTRLVDALAAAFAEATINVPVRHRHALGAGEHAPTSLIMPAWNASYLGVKVVNVFPGNAARGRPTVTGTYLLMDGGTGELLAVLDADELTAWRTAAASLLAASCLAHPDSAALLVVGAGRIARQLVAAYGSAFPLRRIVVWDRHVERARRLVDQLGLAHAEVATDLASACTEADIITCATLAEAPLVHGAWLRPGTHLDLVGGFKPTMREADDEAVRRARVYVDSLHGALAEAGDIMMPLKNGVIGESDIVGDLFALMQGHAPGRRSEREVTLFKSVGHALEDLVAAATVYESTRGHVPPTGPARRG